MGVALNLYKPIFPNTWSFADVLAFVCDPRFQFVRQPENPDRNNEIQYKLERVPTVTNSAPY